MIERSKAGKPRHPHESEDASQEGGIEGENRFRDNTEKLERTIDDLANRISSGLSETRESIEGPLREAEELIQTLKNSVVSGAHQAEMLFDRFESLYDELKDPVARIKRDPRAAFGAVILAGIVVGLFVQRGESGSAITKVRSIFGGRQ